MAHRMLRYALLLIVSGMLLSAAVHHHPNICCQSAHNAILAQGTQPEPECGICQVYIVVAGAVVSAALAYTFRVILAQAFIVRDAGFALEDSIAGRYGRAPPTVSLSIQ